MKKECFEKEDAYLIRVCLFLNMVLSKKEFYWKEDCNVIRVLMVRYEKECTLLRYCGEQNLSPQSQSCNKFGLFPCQATSATCISTDTACSKKWTEQFICTLCGPGVVLCIQTFWLESSLWSRVIERKRCQKETDDLKPLSDSSLLKGSVIKKEGGDWIIVCVFSC